MINELINVLFYYVSRDKLSVTYCPRDHLFVTYCPCEYLSATNSLATNCPCDLVPASKRPRRIVPRLNVRSSIEWRNIIFFRSIVFYYVLGLCSLPRRQKDLSNGTKNVGWKSTLHGQKFGWYSSLCVVWSSGRYSFQQRLENRHILHR
jgi:hypothetical protein